MGEIYVPNIDAIPYELTETIPEGYRPKGEQHIPCLARDNGTWANANFHSAEMSFLKTGEIKIRTKLSENNLYFTVNGVWMTS